MSATKTEKTHSSSLLLSLPLSLSLYSSNQVPKVADVGRRLDSRHARRKPLGAVRAHAFDYEKRRRGPHGVSGARGRGRGKEGERSRGRGDKSC